MTQTTADASVGTYNFAGPRELPVLRDERLGNVEDPNLGWHLHKGVLDAAAATLPDFDLQREDLPSDCGLVVFGQPVYTIADDYGDEDEPVPIAAVAWSVILDGPPQWPNGGIWLTFYGDLTSSARHAELRQMVRGRGLDAGHYAPHLAHNDVGGWPFVADGLHLPREERQDLMSKVGPILKTTWLLMQQPIATTTTVAPDRATRRRAERAGREPQVVRVIALRMAASDGQHDGDGSREYHHRWVVRGHWRNQWMPGRKVHRPTWINPHIKGPEDAPLLTGEKVYAWRR